MIYNVVTNLLNFYNVAYDEMIMSDHYILFPISIIFHMEDITEPE